MHVSKTFQDVWSLAAAAALWYIYLKRGGGLQSIFNSQTTRCLLPVWVEAGGGGAADFSTQPVDPSSVQSRFWIISGKKSTFGFWEGKKIEEAASKQQNLSLMFTIALDIYVTHKLSYVACCLRGDGVMDSVFPCGAGEPGSIPALSKWFFSGV